MTRITLRLNKHWYDLIASGIKTEEYREIKDYWTKRFCLSKQQGDCLPGCDACIAQHMGEVEGCQWCLENSEYVCYPYDEVEFTMGYPKREDTSRRMVFEIKSIEIGRGEPAWGADPDHLYYVIKLGRRIS